MAQSKIPPAVEPEILKLTGAGKTTRQIADRLAKKGVKVSHVAVANFLKRARSSRAADAKEVVREKLASTLTSDLDELELERARVARLAVALGEKAEARLNPTAVGRYLRVVASLAKLTDLKLHYAGADTPDEKTDDGAAERVLGRMASILEAADPAPKAPPVH